MSFGMILHDFLEGNWEDAKWTLREELEQLYASLQRLENAVVGISGDLELLTDEDGTDIATITAGAVTTEKVADAAITEDKLEDGSITEDKLADGSITSLKIAPNSVTNTRLADMDESTIKGRAVGAGTGDPTDLTATQATAILNVVVGDSGSGGTKGLVPAPAAGDTAANKFLKANGSWVAVTSAIADADYGDITASSSGTVLTIDNDVVTNAKMANMAQATIKGRASAAGTGDPTDLTADQVSTILDTATDPFSRASAEFWTTIRRTADKDISSNTTFADDGQLQFDMTAATLYTFQMFFVYSSPVGGATPDLKFQFAGPATLTGVWSSFIDLNTSDVGVSYNINLFSTTGAIGTATTPRLCQVDGWCYSTAGGSGASGFRFQWAQNTSNANATRVHAGSVIRYRALV